MLTHMRVGDGARVVVGKGCGLEVSNKRTRSPSRPLPTPAHQAPPAAMQPLKRLS
jgi:hypothetical protein